MDTNKKRDSNIELFRIITMLFIVFHHYVVNSGLYSNGHIIGNPLSSRSIFLLLIGAWGKVGINCFVLITGFFMCRSEITVIKFAKLFGEVMFYRLVIGGAFLLTGYQEFSLRYLVNMLIPIRFIDKDFSVTYLVFFLFIPFINIFIRNINKQQYIRVLSLLLFTYTFFGSIPFFGVTMNYVSWFIVIYLIGAYIRLYPRNFYSNNRIVGMLTIVSILLCIISILISAKIGERINGVKTYYCVNDCNMVLTIIVSVGAFLFFKNLKLPYIKILNTIASTTFGVLLIHANSDTMRKWLWIDVVNCVGHYNDKYMPLYVIVSCVCIFFACSLIDILRIYFIEKRFLMLFEKKENCILDFMHKVEDYL